MKKHEKHDKLIAWMTENSFDSSRLAHELGFTYNYIHKLREGDKPLGSGFKLKFLLHFGSEEANKVFDVAPHPEPA